MPRVETSLQHLQPNFPQTSEFLHLFWHFVGQCRPCFPLKIKQVPKVLHHLKLASLGIRMRSKGRTKRSPETVRGAVGGIALSLWCRKLLVLAVCLPYSNRSCKLLRFNCAPHGHVLLEFCTGTTLLAHSARNS